MVALAQLKECSCRPAARFDWCAFVPENGAGPLVTQFHASPPEPEPVAPAGSASSTQAVVGVAGGGVAGGGVAVLLTVTVSVAEVVLLPAASRAMARSVCVPLAAVVEFHAAVKGAAVSSAPRLTPSSWNWTPITPMLSEAL